MIKHRLNTLVLLVLSIVVTLAACVPAPTQQPAAASTATQAPTSTPTVPTATPTPVPPTATPVPPTATPVPPTPTPAPEQSPEEDESKSITSHVWEWERFLSGDGSVVEVDDPSRYTLMLNPDGTYQIKADCNTSVGAYTWDEAHLEIKPGPTTLAECGPGSLYNDFLKRLGHVRTYVYDDDGNLVLDLWADAGQMVFRNADQAPDEPSLEGTLWQLTGYAKDGTLVEVLEGTEITAEFGEEQIAGSAGCNRYMGAYTVEGSTVTLGPIASTRKMCGAPEGIMEQEQGYLTALESANAYRIDGDKLDLVDAEGELVATFVASTDQNAE